MLLTDEGEPESFEEAKDDTHSRKWLSVMQDEMDSLDENHTYELVELPKGKRALRNKCVYKVKPGDGGNPPRYKARIMVKGFHQEEGRGLRRDICSGSQDDLHPNGAKHSSQHEPRSRVAGREDDIPSW